MHTAKTLTSVVLPEFCNPTRVNSISSLKKRPLNQSKKLLNSDAISTRFKKVKKISKFFYSLFKKIFEGIFK